MKNLQDATERICELKGSLIAIEALLPAVLEALPQEGHDALMKSFDAHSEAARTVMLHTPISDHVLSAFERDIARTRGVLTAMAGHEAAARIAPPVEPVLLATTPIRTYSGEQHLTGASGFFFRRDDRLYVVTNRHVFVDPDNNHLPDAIEIEVHTDPRDLASYVSMKLPLYANGLSLWRQASDGAGTVDVAALEVDPDRLPQGAVLQALDVSNLDTHESHIGVGEALAIVGFPLGFHDTVHRLPVVRSGAVASAYGLRFQRQGYFLTDARTHRGSSGSPVLRRRTDVAKDGSLATWQLLGVHSSRMDMSTRDRQEDESLGLNCAWYADVLLVLTAR